MDLMNTRGDSSPGEETPQLVFLWRNPLLSSPSLLTILKKKKKSHIRFLGNEKLLTFHLELKRKQSLGLTSKITLRKS